MKLFVAFVIILLFYLNFIETNPPELCNGVKYIGDAIDDKTGETIFTYSFKMQLILDDKYPPNYNQNALQITEFNVTYLQNSNLKFHHLTYTEQYHGCNSLTDIKEYDTFELPDQEIKFILTFIEDEEEISGNDLCQNNKTRFVDTITMFINDVNIFDAETGQIFYDYIHFTKDDSKPLDNNFLNGKKSVECSSMAFMDVNTAQENCINFEGNVSVLNFNNDDHKVGQILYSIDSESLNFSMHSLEDWYVHILPFCLDNSTECSITLPPIDEDFEYPIQLITSFGSFYIGYIIRRLGIFLKYEYLPNYHPYLRSYGEPAFTFNDPCWSHTFSYPKFNGTIKSLICCTKFDRNWPTTTATITTTTSFLTETTITSIETTDMFTKISTSISQTISANSTEIRTTGYSYISSFTDVFSTMSTPNARNQKDDKSSKKTPIIWIIVGSIGGLLIIILLIILLYFYRKKQQEKRAAEETRLNPRTMF